MITYEIDTSKNLIRVKVNGEINLSKIKIKLFNDKAKAQQWLI